MTADSWLFLPEDGVTWSCSMNGIGYPLDHSRKEKAVLSDMRVVAIIPARGGSKTIPKKNIRPLAGKPLIYYTVEEAKRSKYLDRILVSTDDDEIARICRGFGVEVIERPPEFATDTSPTELALIHVVETLKDKEGYEADVIVTLEPTSPLRTYELIDKCIETLLRNDCDSVISAIGTRECFGRIIGGKFDYLIKDQPRRRQDREPFYKESSTVYVTRTETLFKLKSVLGERLYAVIAEEDEAMDINTPLDFVIAEAVMQWRQGGKT